jgi:hypothetical protein
MTTRKSVSLTTILVSSTLLSSMALADAPNAPADKTKLEAEFRNPPMEARPRVWWHWMNGNISKDGIAKDLQWMADIGIGGFQNFDANLATPQVVDKRLVYMAPDWQEAFRFAVNEAERHSLEMAIAASPGWSETGGPWVTPQDGMKKLVWGETLLKGGKRFSGKLNAAPDETGPYQNVPFVEEMPGGPQAGHKPKASGNIAVIAVPVLASGLPTPTYMANGNMPLDAAVLTDADFGSSADVALAPDLSGSVTISYAKPVTVRSMRVFLPGLKLPFRGVPLKASFEVRDGSGWRHIDDVTITSVPTTHAFAPATGREFRLRLEDITGGKSQDVLGGAPGAVAVDFFNTSPLTKVRLAELRLSGEAHVNHAEEKAGYETVLDYHAIADTDTTATGALSKDVIDLTNRVRADGSLDWTPPKGSDWRVLRFGWSLTGKTNHPATPEATGLEVDKFDAAAVRRYLETYLSKYRDTVGAENIGKRGLRAILTDSIEVGKSNWTPAMEAEFAKRRGYALRPWLPALAGVVIGTPAETERFLYDYRRTLADLLADMHYKTVAEVAHENGLTVYGEALEEKRPLLGDDLAMRRHADVPMAALWTFASGSSVRTTLIGDMKGAASVAHVYGKRFVAAESMTSVNSPWDFAPKDLKPFIDLEFVSGINRPVVHTSVHQPRDDMQPGLSLAIFGQYFNRHESWAPMAKPWVDYMARTSYLLQQGKNVADVAWFIGEESPVTALFAEKIPAGLPKAHAYDFVNADMLADALKSDGGEVVSEGGARYKAIYLGGTSHRMTLPTLTRLAELVRSGATLIGEKPSGTPSLADDAAAFAKLADALWAGDTGKGRVIATGDIDAALATAGIAPGVRFDSADDGAPIPFVERAFDGGRLFFLSNPGKNTRIVTARFRASGKAPELWDAQTGTARPLSYRMEGGETLVPLTLAPDDAVFVVFRKDTSAATQTVTAPSLAPAGTVSGTWAVAFQPGRGAPAQTEMKQLSRLDKNATPGIRYFSGIATYTNSFAAPKGWKAGQPLWLDLGEVHDLAEVRINGKSAGTLWRAPWRINIGALAKAGKNMLEIRVANKWVNRLIGDAQPGAAQIAKIAAPGYLPNAPLRPSGLIGPVRLAVEAK